MRHFNRIGRQYYLKDDTSSKTLWHEKYESVPALIAACKKAWHEGRRTPFISKERDSWVGRSFRSVEEVEHAYMSRWEEGMAMVKGMIYEVERNLDTPPPKIKRRRPQYNEFDGDEVDFDRMRSGQDFWRVCKRQETTGPQFISLFTASTTSGGMSCKDVLWRGVCGVIITDILEKAGYRVQMIIVDHTSDSYTHNPGNDFVSAVIKREDDPVDLCALINATSGWFYRTLVGFQSRHIRGVQVSVPGYGYCQAISVKTPEVIELAGVGSLPIVIDNVWSREAALQKVREVIQQVNSQEGVV